MHGIAWQDAERLAAGRHARYEQTDVWETAIEKWLSAVAATGTTHAGIAPCARPLTIAEVLSGAIGLNTSHQDFKAEKRAARVLRQLGYERQSVRVDGATAKRWVKPNRALG
jgi:predicted P-loop ATPase